MNSKSLKRHFSGDKEHIYPTKKQRSVLYLEDNTPIRTIQVTNIDDYVCAGYLRAYFECTVGPVTDATIVNDENQKTRVGYVTFTMPEDAAKLLFGLKCKFTIKQAENAYQPKIDPKVLKFEEINDDCLLHIVSFLNLIDTINLGKASDRLHSLVEAIYCKRTFFSFGSTNTGDLSINKKNIPTILQEMGKYFQSIQWINLKDRQIDELCQSCKNVTSLHLVAPILHLNSIERNQLWFKNLKSLKIENADLFDVHIDTVIALSTQLKSLQLLSCGTIRGNFLLSRKDSELKYLRIIRCPGISTSNITEFQRNNKLIKFSTDMFDSFITCLSLPTACLYNYTELELAVNSSTDELLEHIKFDELKQLEKIHLKCTVYNYTLDLDVTVPKNFNKIFAALSPVNSLNSLTVEFINIDADTFKCLGSIQNLQELNLKNICKGMEKELYSSLHVHLPKLTKLSISMLNSTLQIDTNSIVTMVSGLVDLKYFSHSSTTWDLLNMIRLVRFNMKQPPIEIGVSRVLFHSPKMVDFAAVSKGAVSLSLIK